MNEGQHIALTEAQIIAAEKGEIQLEYRNGEKVCQVVWFRPPYNQNNSAIKTIDSRGNIRNHTIIGMSRHFDDYDLFVSEPKPAEPKPLYEVGEIIEVKGEIIEVNAIDTETWKDAEFIAMSRNYCLIWRNDTVYRYSSGHHRKKQTEKTVTIEGEVMTVKEAFKYLTNIQ